MLVISSSHRLWRPSPARRSAIPAATSAAQSRTGARPAARAHPGPSPAGPAGSVLARRPGAQSRPRRPPAGALLVDTGPEVDLDHEELGEGAERVADRPEAGALDVAPGHPALPDGDPHALGHAEDLDVESPAVHPLAREELPGDLGREELEPALGVGDPVDDEQPDQEVAQPADQDAASRLAPLNAG